MLWSSENNISQTITVEVSWTEKNRTSLSPYFPNKHESHSPDLLVHFRTNSLQMLEIDCTESTPPDWSRCSQRRSGRASESISCRGDVQTFLAPAPKRRAENHHSQMTSWGILYPPAHRRQSVSQTPSTITPSPSTPRCKAPFPVGLLFSLHQIWLEPELGGKEPAQQYRIIAFCDFPTGIGRLYDTTDFIVDIPISDVSVKSSFHQLCLRGQLTKYRFPVFHSLHHEYWEHVNNHLIEPFEG